MILARRALTHLGLLVVLSVSCCLFAPSCVSVLELDDYDDAIAALCKCDMDVPQFDGQCVETLKSRLDAVSEPARAKWLSFYAEACQGTCSSAFACFQNVGTCAQRTCTEDRECCDYAEGGGQRCIDGECDACRALGAECTRDEACCDEMALCTGGVCELQGSGGGGPDDPPPAD